MMNNISHGKIMWHDLTVPNAERVRDFYAAVLGWTPKGENCGGHEDYNMLAADGECVAGVCHAKGENADLPAQWLMYVAVDDAEAAARRCTENGGRVVVGPRPCGTGVLCVIADPAGAVCALFQK